MSTTCKRPLVTYLMKWGEALTISDEKRSQAVVARALTRIMVIFDGLGNECDCECEKVSKMAISDTGSSPRSRLIRKWWLYLTIINGDRCQPPTAMKKKVGRLIAYIGLSLY